MYCALANTFTSDNTPYFHHANAVMINDIAFATVVVNFLLRPSAPVKSDKTSGARTLYTTKRFYLKKFRKITYGNQDNNFRGVCKASHGCLQNL